MLMGYTEGKYKTGWWSSGHRTTNHDTLVCEKTAESGPACATSVYFPKAGCKILPDVSLKLFKDRIPEGSSQELGSMKEDTGQQANNWPLTLLSTFLPSEPPGPNATATEQSTLHLTQKHTLPVLGPHFWRQTCHIKFVFLSYSWICSRVAVINVVVVEKGNCISTTERGKRIACC